jgi:hypothetical protein
MTTAKTLTALAVLSGVLAGQPAHTQETDDWRPHSTGVKTPLNSGSSKRMAGNGARPMPAATAFATPASER